MAKKKINKEELGRELMELMEVSAPMYIFDPLYFAAGDWVPNSMRIENILIARGEWEWDKNQSLFDVIENHYGKRAVEIIKILLAN